MTHVMIQHKVRDYPAWKEQFDNFADVRRSFGEKSYRILHPSGDPNDLLLIFEWDNLKNAETFLASPELRSAMNRAGVVEAPRIQFLNEVAQGSL